MRDFDANPRDRLSRSDFAFRSFEKAMVETMT